MEDVKALLDTVIETREIHLEAIMKMKLALGVYAVDTIAMQSTLHVNDAKRLGESLGINVPWTLQSSPYPVQYGFIYRGWHIYSQHTFEEAGISLGGF